MDTPFKIYNASAGSGKTYTLTKEYLKIVLSSSKAYRNILAITFTNKAVNEMKSRILNSLFDFSKTLNEDGASSLFQDVAEELNISITELQQKAAVVLKEILHNYAFFDVSTIDKFTHRLIRTFAKDLKLPQNFEVVLDTDLLLDEAVSKLINKAGRDIQLTKVLIDFALEKADNDKSWDISIDLNQIGKLLFNETDTSHLKKIANKEIQDFLELQKGIKTKLVLIESEMIAAATSALELITENGLEFKNFSASYFPKFMMKIQQGDLNIDFKAGWKQNFETAPLYPKSTAESTKALMDNLHTEFINRFNSIKNHSERRQLLKNVYKNIVPLTVLNAIQKEVKTIEAEKNQLSISEFNSIISNEIKDQPAPFIYERLGEKYRHYFVDEFQDTSEMQWNNLIPLIDNALSSEMGSLFLVGDAKQAIYRWRGGKAEQFLNLINLETNPFVAAPKIEPLPSNYRSHEEIIKFNNDFFTATSPMLNNSIYRNLFEEGNKQTYNAKKGGQVQLTFLEPTDEEKLEDQYCEEALKKIVTVAENGYQYQDICILVRGNKEGVLLADFLTEHQIPLISSESLLLKSNPKVRFLVNLLRLQDQPKDLDLAYEMLTFLCQSKPNKHLFISKYIESLETLLTLEYSFELKRLKTLSVYDGLEYAIKQFDLAPESDAYISYFMDVAIEVEQKEGIGAHLFLNYWDKKKERLSITAPSNVNAVQIMTVHKAKGLEFEIVIFPFANSNIYKEIDPKIWLPVDSEYFNGFDEVLINKKQEVLNYSRQAELQYNEEQHKLELDAFNVLYVALTRAVKALFIITKKDLAKSGAHKPDYYSGLFIHYLKEKGIWNQSNKTYTFGALLVQEEKKLATQQNIPYQYSFKDRPDFKILAKSGVLWDTDREDALAKGNLIHFIMGLIETEHDVEKALEGVKISGAITSSEIEELQNKIHQLVQHPNLSEYYKSGQTILNERDIITEAGKLLRPDRIVILKNKATIIDYKTGKKDPKYKEQLYAYADALETMGYAVENKIIIYINEDIIPEFI